MLPRVQKDLLEQELKNKRERERREKEQKEKEREAKEKKAKEEEINRLNIALHREEDRNAELTIRTLAGADADAVLTLLRQPTDDFDAEEWPAKFKEVIRRMLGNYRDAERILYAAIEAAIATERDSEQSSLGALFFTLIARDNPRLLPAVQNVIAKYCSSNEAQLSSFIPVLEFAANVQVETIANAQADVQSQRIFLQRMVACFPPPAGSHLERTIRYQMYRGLFLALLNSLSAIDINENKTREERQKAAHLKKEKLLGFLAMLRMVDYSCYLQIKNELRDPFGHSFGLTISGSQGLLSRIEATAGEFEKIAKQQAQENGQDAQDAIMDEFLCWRDIDIFTNANLSRTGSWRYDNSKNIAYFVKVHPELAHDFRMQYHYHVVVNKELGVLATLLKEHYADCLALLTADLNSKKDAVATTILRLLKIFIHECDQHHLVCPRSEDLKKYLAARRPPQALTTGSASASESASASAVPPNSKKY